LLLLLFIIQLLLLLYYFILFLYCIVLFVVLFNLVALLYFIIKDCYIILLYTSKETEKLTSLKCTVAVFCLFYPCLKLSTEVGKKSLNVDPGKNILCLIT